MTQVQSDFGKATERAFIRGTYDMRDQGRFPSWLNFFCAASDKEDSEGIDAWAYSDVGKIPLQIKSGRAQRDLFRKRANRKHIPCVAVPPRAVFTDIFAEALMVLSAERDRILQARATQS